MIKYVIAILAILSGMESAHGCESLNFEGIAKLKGNLTEKDIGKVRIFSRPYTRLAAIPVSSKILEENWEIMINSNNSSKNMYYASSILQEISNVKLCPAQIQPDLYWGLVIYNREGQRIFSVYLEGGDPPGSRIRGQIDGVAVEAPLTLLRWFEARFATRGTNIP